MIPQKSKEKIQFTCVNKCIGKVKSGGAKLSYELVVEFNKKELRKIDKLVKEGKYKNREAILKEAIKKYLG